MAYGAVGTCRGYKKSCKRGYEEIDKKKGCGIPVWTKSSIFEKKLDKIPNKYTLMRI